MQTPASQSVTEGRTQQGGDQAPAAAHCGRDCTNCARRAACAAIIVDLARRAG